MLAVAKVTEVDSQEYRRERARSAWKHAVWGTGGRMPTQFPNGCSRYFCAAEIAVAGIDQHIYAAHMDITDSDSAARKFVEIVKGNRSRAARICIEKVNVAFIKSRVRPRNTKLVHLERAVAKGWLRLHESGTYAWLTATDARKRRAQSRCYRKEFEHRQAWIPETIGLARSASPTLRRYWNVSVAVLGRHGGTV